MQPALRLLTGWVHACVHYLKHIVPREQHFLTPDLSWAPVPWSDATAEQDGQRLFFFSTVCKENRRPESGEVGRCTNRRQRNTGTHLATPLMLAYKAKIFWLVLMCQKLAPQVSKAMRESQTQSSVLMRDGWHISKWGWVSKESCKECVAQISGSYAKVANCCISSLIVSFLEENTFPHQH